MLLEGRESLPEVSYQSVSIVKMHKAAVALADIAGEVHAAHVLKEIVARVHADLAEFAERVILLMSLQLIPREVAQLQRKHVVCLPHISESLRCAVIEDR